jgi:hypothetical protein
MRDDMPTTNEDGSFNFEAVIQFKDDSPKAFFINKKLLLGYIGHRLPVVEDFISKQINTETTFEEAVEKAKEVVNADRHILKNFRTALILGGITSSGKTAIFSARTDSGVFSMQDQTDKRLEYLGTTANFDVMPWVEEQLSNGDTSFPRLIYLANELGKYAAERDPLISPKFSLFAIGG